MQNSLKKTLVLTLAAALAAGMLAGCSNKKDSSPSPSPSAEIATQESPSPSPSASPSVLLTKAQIEAKLKQDRANLLDVTWSPDESAVIYLRTDKGGANICLWRTTQQAEQVVRKVEATLDGFVWSPDSRYFIIETGHSSSPNTLTSSIIEAKTLKQYGEDLTTVSVSAPLWSPDSKYLALSNSDDTGKIALNIFALASKSSVSIVSAENAKGPYIVEYWKDDTIGYTTLTESGERAEQTVAIGD